MEMLKLKRPFQICSMSILWKDSETTVSFTVQGLGKCGSWCRAGMGGEGCGREHGHLYSKTSEKDLNHASSGCNWILPRKMWSFCCFKSPYQCVREVRKDVPDMTTILWSLSEPSGTSYLCCKYRLKRFSQEQFGKLFYSLNTCCCQPLIVIRNC